MGATRRHRNQALNQAKLDKLNEAADEQQRQLDPEGMSRARDKIHTFTRRTDDLTANWARFLVFSSGFLAVVICSSLVSRTDMSFKALLSAKLAVLTSICSGSYAHGFRRDEAKVCAILLLAVQAGVHFSAHRLSLQCSHASLAQLDICTGTGCLWQGSTSCLFGGESRFAEV
eukprot:TRINITY_DN20629_c0_g1_i4.p1 TRINITY_DN20629_c0_g1~~TRINITY_DN20629_c0_g1_i4.p1  ORF type:complete len:173 (-),score=27.80 TRINITY_DN20629_c0_g1_i4:395-913(-)